MINDFFWNYLELILPLKTKKQTEFYVLPLTVDYL